MNQIAFTYESLLTRRDQRQRIRELWQMTPEQRVRAMRAGELTFGQCLAWSRRYPEQVPLIDGEFEYIAGFTPEVCE